VLSTSIIGRKQRGDGYETRYLSINRTAQYDSVGVSHESSLSRGHRSHENERKKERKMGSIPADRNTVGGKTKEGCKDGESLTVSPEGGTTVYSNERLDLVSPTGTWHV
jgi:hypothetical protein